MLLFINQLADEISKSAENYWGDKEN